MNDVTLTGLELTERIMRDNGDDIAYIALSKITDRNRSVGAARVDFSAVGLDPWLKRPVGASEDEDPEDEEPEDDGEPDLGSALAEGLVSPRALASAAIRWVRETVAALMAGRTHGKFKINLWSPSGKTLIHPARFEAKNPGARRRPADEEAEVEAERSIVTTMPPLPTSRLRCIPRRPDRARRSPRSASGRRSATDTRSSSRSPSPPTPTLPSSRPPRSSSCSRRTSVSRTPWRR